jgi:putative mRNA 3-end processing factor
MRATDLLQSLPEGLYCPPANIFIDPMRPVERALITHGHSDHACSGHAHVLATQETLAIMAARYGSHFAGATEVAKLGEIITHNGVAFRFHPAGHVLGSAQIEIDYRGFRAVVSGDYKRAADPTCLPFEPVRCDLFITEATFALPVFRHPPLQDEVKKLLASLALFPERSHLVGAYSLGKAQRVMALIRAAGFDAPIYLHGALEKLTRLYEAHGIALGDVRPVAGTPKAEMKGAIILCPPSALQDLWCLSICVGLDAHSSTRQATRRGIAARHFRSRRLGRVTRDNYRDRRIRNLGDTWPRRRSCPLVPHARFAGRSIAACRL